MALVNVAAQLAKMGRKVLLVDFDLEVRQDWKPSTACGHRIIIPK